MHGPHVHSRIVQALNRKNNSTDHAIEFDKEKKLVDGLKHEDSCSSMPCNTSTKKLLKTGVERANIIDYRCKDKTKKRNHTEVELPETVVSVNLTDSVFLGSMLNENDEGNSVILDPGEDAHEINADSLSDEESNFKLHVSAFQVDEDEDENGRSPSHELVDSEREHNCMGGEWKWNCWDDIGND